MTQWDFYDISVLKAPIKPDVAGTKAGFPIYDITRKSKFPNYYGIIMTTKDVQRQMFDSGINGGYSLLPRNNKIDAYTTTLKKETDYEKAIEFPHFARHIYGNTKTSSVGRKLFRSENPEIEDFQDGNLKNLLTLTERGVSIKDIAGYLDWDIDTLAQLYYRLRR